MAQGAISRDERPDVLLGREFTTAIIMFQEAVGRLLNLSAVERKCVDLLRRLGPVTAGTLSEHTGLTTGAVTGLMDRLEKAGYVRRERDSKDRRKVVVELLPNQAMDSLLEAVFVPFAQDMGAVAARYDNVEIRAIADWAHRTTDVLVEHTRRIESMRRP